MTVFAHTGHWLVNLLYVAPVAVLVGALALQSVRDRRRNRDDSEKELIDRDS